jgi:hypothetical protein
MGVMSKRTLFRILLALVTLLPAMFLLLARRSLSEYQGLCPGDPVPQADLLTRKSVTMDTASWRGTPTVLVVFQTGCESCRREIESLAACARSFPQVRIALLATESAVGSVETSLPIYTDPGGSFQKKVRKLVTPAVYWIDAGGTVRYARTGLRNAREEEALFRRMLKGEGTQARGPATSLPTKSR